MTGFKGYTHVVRLDHEDAEGLLQNDKVYISAKIDGTNGCIWYDEKREKICAGSRTRELSQDNDNASFFSWVYSDADEAIKLRELVKAYPDFIVYGEWLGIDKFIGHIKSYDDCAQGHFYIFDMYDTNNNLYLHEYVWRDIAISYELEEYCVKLLAVLNHPSYEDVVKIAENNKFLLSHAEHAGEGVVCKVPGWKNKYGHTCYGKIVLDEFKQFIKKGKHRPQLQQENIETDIVEYFITEAELTKAKAKTCVICEADDFDKKSGKMVGIFLNLCWNDLLDEMRMICKKYHNPIINMKMLQIATQNKGRKFLGLS